MNRLDDFFKDRLTDHTEAGNGWNVPSDDLWNKALPHLPKKKKRKTGFIWFFLGMVFAIGLTALYSDWTRNDLLTDSNKAQHQDVYKETETTNSKRRIKTQTEKEVDLFAEGETLRFQKSNTQKPNVSNIVAVDQSHNIKEQYRNIVGRPGSNTQNTLAVNQMDNLDPVKDQDISITNQNIYATKNNVESKQEIFENGPRSINASDKADLKENNVRETSLINHVPVRSHLLTTNKPVLKPLTVSNHSSIIPILSSFPKSEVGISYNHLLLDVLGGLDIETDGPMDVTSSSTNYNGLNLEYAYWIKPQWSISTGLYFSKLDWTIDLCIFDQLEAEDLNAFVGSNIDNILPRSEFSAGERIELLDGVELAEGDVLNIKGVVGLDIKAVQVPVMVNRHWNANRFEFYAGAGLTLDRLWFRQNSVEVRIFKEGEFITAPIMQQEEEEVFWDLSIYSQFGIRYKLSPQFNLGLGAQINVTEPVFSAVKAGIYYRLLN